MKEDKGIKLLIEAYDKNLVCTIDTPDYEKGLKGFYSLQIIKKLENLLGK